MEKLAAPVPTIRRIPTYLYLLNEFDREGYTNVSATDIAGRLSLKPIQVRKDMAFTGIVGKPRVGYNVKELIETIRTFLNWKRETRAVLIGAGALGTALLGFKTFRSHGIHILAGFDNDPSKVGKVLHEIPIQGIDGAPEFIRSNDVEMVIITVPADEAQSAADLISGTGIKGIWNFSPVKLQVPAGVSVQQEDLSTSLAVLTVKMAGHPITEAE